MEAAQQAFLITIAIVGGILSPFIFILLLNLINNFLIALAHRLNIIIEESKKAPPYDDVELNLNPATNILSARLIKKDEIVWQGSVTRKELEEAPSAGPIASFRRDQ